MWNAFAAVTGGASGALTGLTFLVVAFRFDTIAVSPEYRNRAAQTLTLFFTVTVVAVLITVPHYTETLGIELMLVALISAALLRFLDSAARRGQTTRPSTALAVALIMFVVFIEATGLLVLLGADWGMYFYVASATVGLAWGVYGTWIFLTRAGLDD